MRPSIPLGILAATAALTVPADTLRALIHARKGDVYDVHNLYLDLIALWNTGRFEDVGIETQPAGSGHPLAAVARVCARSRPIPWKWFSMSMKIPN